MGVYRYLSRMLPSAVGTRWTTRSAGRREGSCSKRCGSASNEPLVNVLERYRERWDPKELAELAPHLWGVRGFPRRSERWQEDEEGRRGYPGKPGFRGFRPCKTRHSSRVLRQNTSGRIRDVRFFTCPSNFAPVTKLVSWRLRDSLNQKHLLHRPPRPLNTSCQKHGSIHQEGKHSTGAYARGGPTEAPRMPTGLFSDADRESRDVYAWLLSS
jgi:hypothetical protein